MSLNSEPSLGILSSMDQPQPSHLARHLTGITADLRTRANSASGPRAMLLALIEACFLRIFARLEAIIALWQAGQLPQPSARQPRTPQPGTPQPHPTAPGTPSAARHRAHARAILPKPPVARATPTPTCAFAAANHRPASALQATPSPRPPVPTATRTPPIPRCRQKRPPGPAHNFAYIVTITKLLAETYVVRAGRQGAPATPSCNPDTKGR